MSMRPPAVILAGGLSRRMGSDKADALLDGRPMLDHVVVRIRPQVSSFAINAPAPLPGHPDVPVVPDTVAGYAGPLAGVLAGLRHFSGASEATHLLTVPVDTPFLPQDLSERLASAVTDAGTIVVARSEGRIHPVAALWPLSIADDLEAWLSDPANRKLQLFLGRHPLVTVDFDAIDNAEGPVDPFFNVNSPDDLAIAERIVKSLRP